MSNDLSPHAPPSRRAFLTGAAAFMLVAPATVRFGSLMPISTLGLEATSCTWTPIIHRGGLLHLPHPGRGLMFWHWMANSFRGQLASGGDVVNWSGEDYSRDAARRVVAHQSYILRCLEEERATARRLGPNWRGGRF